MWEIGVVVGGEDPRNFVRALESQIGPCDATGCVLSPEFGTPGDIDAQWWFEDQLEANMLREILDTTKERWDRDEAAPCPLLQVSGPRWIGDDA